MLSSIYHSTAQHSTAQHSTISRAERVRQRKQSDRVRESQQVCRRESAVCSSLCSQNQRRNRNLPRQKKKKVPVFTSNLNTIQTLSFDACLRLPDCVSGAWSSWHLHVVSVHLIMDLSASFTLFCSVVSLWASAAGGSRPRSEAPGNNLTAVSGIRLPLHSLSRTNTNFECVREWDICRSTSWHILCRGRSFITAVQYTHHVERETHEHTHPLAQRTSCRKYYSGIHGRLYRHPASMGYLSLQNTVIAFSSVSTSWKHN